MILQISPLSQRDQRWRSNRLGTVNGVTIGSDGCLITDMCMIATYYGHPIFPNEINDILTSRNLYYDGDLFVHGSITKIFSDIKFDKVVWCETTPAPISDIKSYLDQGKPVVVALINQGVKHFILVTGYEGDRMFANDPWQGDSVAINDRWGDPVRKILQVNFFSGPVSSQTQPIPTPPQPAVPIQPTPQAPIIPPAPVDAGGDEDGNGHDVVRNETIPQPQVTTDSTISILPPPIQEKIDVALQKLEDVLNVHRPKEGEKPKLPSFIDSLKSRKFILAALSSLVALINSTFHLGITETQLILFLIPVIAYIVAEGLADAFERARK